MTTHMFKLHLAKFLKSRGHSVREFLELHKNFRNTTGEYNELIRSRPTDIISANMIWDATPQGHMYWQRISVEWKGYYREVMDAGTTTAATTARIYTFPTISGL